MGGCASAPSPYSATGGGVEELTLGSSVSASLDQTDAVYEKFKFDVYRFTAEPGTEVTVTARTQGPGLYVGLAHYDVLRWPPYFAKDEYNYELDQNSGHSEVIATLPEDEDGVYYIWVSGIPEGSVGVYSIELLEGAQPALDIRDPGYTPYTIEASEPILGNTGKYMSPYTEDGTVALWVEKGLQARAAASAGMAVGSFAGNLNDSSYGVLGVAGALAGGLAAKQAMLSAAGGWEAIKENSDLSFDSFDDMARYLEAQYRSHPHYEDVLSATYMIYPRLSNSVLELRLKDPTVPYSSWAPPMHKPLRRVKNW